MPTIEELRELQAMPLEQKLIITNARIDEWIAKNGGTDSVYVSFSGGKDSTVLLHLVRQRYPDVEAVFCDTGLEYPEIREFVKSFDNVIILRPKMNFRDVIIKYGYPVITKRVSRTIGDAQRGVKWALDYVNLTGSCVSDDKKISRYNVSKYKDLLNVDFRISNKCCDIMKKNPIHKFDKKNNKKAMTAQMAIESDQRTATWLMYGCNMFNAKNPTSNPMSFWTEKDVLQYIKGNDIKIASVYGNIIETGKCGQITFEGCGKLCTTGCHRTGCVFCGFGAHLEKGETRYQRLHRTHPKLYDFCINGGDYDSDGLWKPNGKGLGFGHVFDELNKLYGEDFIKY